MACVKTGSIVKTKDGSQFAGTGDLARTGREEVPLRFNKTGDFSDVMALTGDGE